MNIIKVLAVAVLPLMAVTADAEGDSLRYEVELASAAAGVCAPGLTWPARLTILLLSLCIRHTPTCRGGCLR